MSRSLAILAGFAILGSALTCVAPASADTKSFVNTIVTPQTTDLDITSLEVERTPTTAHMELHLENPPTGDSTVTATFLRTGDDADAATTDAFIVTVVTAAGKSTLSAATRVAGVTKPAEVPLGFTGPSADTSIDANSSDIPWAGDVWGIARVTAGGTTATAGAPNGPVIHGFGPVNALSIPTTSTISLSGSSQIYGKTSVTLQGTVSPAAPGTFQIFDGDTALTSVTLDNITTSASYALPNSLAVGTHALHAVFTPTTARFAISTSPSVTLRVIAPNATKTTLKLSHSIQHYKHSRVKATVTVSGEHAGKVQFFDGARKLKTVTLKKGKATYTFSAKLSKKKHVITAVYLPTDFTVYASSSSKKVTLKVVR